MKYSRIQKLISYILLFAFFLNISVNIPPIFSLVLAKESTFYNLVSIIVDEKTYSEIKSELTRYSKDISGVLKNTRVVILPVPEDVSPFVIASMNEGLYFDGYKSLEDVSFESRLTSTVFVGNIPVPVVYRGDDFAKTAFPYVDFEDKAYIFNRETGRYEQNFENSNLKAEIEFSFISPNTGSFEENIKSLKVYFDKNHDYYQETGLYSPSRIRYQREPYVFYYDAFREASGFNPNVYYAYLATRDKNEDFIYGRYTKELLAVMTEASGQTATKGMLTGLLSTIETADTSSFEEVYDIQTRISSESLKKNFINSFSTGVLGELRKDVFNSGRYNFGQNVNVDFIPHIISEIDIVTDQILKSTNDSMEDTTDDFVELVSRKIAVPISVRYEPGKLVSDLGGEEILNFDGLGKDILYYENYLFGENGKDITTAEQCSFYRGSTQFVEANRGLNVLNAEDDAERLKSMGTHCLADLDKGASGTNGLWGKNTPLYIDNNFSTTKISLKKGYDFFGAIEPLFDIKGSKIVPKNGIANINPYQCFDNNYLLDERHVFRTYPDGFGRRSGFELDYKLKGKNWSCTTDNNLGKILDYKFNYIENDIREFDDERGFGTCDVDVYLDGKFIRSIKNSKYPKEETFYDGGEGDGNGGSYYKETTYNCKMDFKYKSIDSVIKHKEPLPTTLSAQGEKMSTQNLPIDSDRYVDFIRTDGRYIKIPYRNLFRYKSSRFESAGLEISFSNDIYGDLFNEILKKTQEKIVYFGNPPLENIYEDIIKKNDFYPYGNFLDLTEKNIANVEKEVVDSLLKVKFNPDMEEYPVPNTGGDSVAFAVMWNNLSTSDKHHYVFEKYLSNDLDDLVKIGKPSFSQNSNLFKPNVLDDSISAKLDFLPRLKEEYEIAYIGSPGDAQNMMIKFEPKLADDSENPYSELISKNQDLSSKIFSYNVVSGTALTDSLGANSLSNNFSGGNKSSSGGDKCAPPGGVPIWEWPQAVECRLKDMMPPKIKMSSGECSSKHLVINYQNSSKINFDSSYDSHNSSELNSSGKISIIDNGDSCTLDENRNGISDCLEALDSIKLDSDSPSYNSKSFITLTADLFEGEDKAIFVNNTPVYFEVLKIEKLDSETEKYKTVYDSQDKNFSDEKIISDYLDFKNNSLSLASIGQAKIGFNAKVEDLIVYLRAKIDIESFDSKGVKKLESQVLKIEINSGNLSSFSSIYSNVDKSFKNTLGVVEASDKENIFILDLKDKNFEDFKNEIDKNSTSENTLIIGLNSLSKSGKILDVKYPIKVEVTKNGHIVQDLSFSNKQEILKLSPLSDSGNYQIKITAQDGLSTIKKFTVSASKPDKVELTLGTNVYLTNSFSTNVFTIYDKYGNPTSGERYLVNLEFSDNKFSLVDELKGNISKQEISTHQGFSTFFVKSGEKIGESTLRLKIIDPETNKEILEKTETFKIIPFADIAFENKNFSVGEKNQKLKIHIVDEKGNKIPGINSRVYLSGASNYFSTNKSYFEIKDSEAEIEFDVKTLSGENIPVDFQVEGLNKIFSKKINIDPGKPVKIDILIDKNKLEIFNQRSTSRDTSGTNVRVELKDKYNNLAINDSSTVVNIEVLEDSKNIISAVGNYKVNKGIANLFVKSQTTPGTGYFKVSTTPSLEENSFEIVDSDQKLKISGVGENIGKIETFYFWNKEKVQKQNYNAIYSVLLGGNYGDIEEQDYLAGSLIFDKDSKALAVTTLIDTGATKENVVSISDNGNIKSIAGGSSLSQNISTEIGFDNGKLFFDIFNKSLNLSIGKVFYNLQDIKVGVCEFEKFSDCFDKKYSSIFGKNISEDYSFEKEGKNLIFKDYSGRELFRVGENGSFDRKENINFVLNKSNTGEYLELNIYRQRELIGVLAVNVLDVSVNTSRIDATFESKKEVLKNFILLKLNSSYYGTFKAGNDLVIYYSDGDNTSSGNKFSRATNGFEKFARKDGLGWKDDNKTLLSFAAGKNVGASVKDYMSFYTINIGDPFLKLKREEKKFNGTNSSKKFDSTIGKIIAKDDDILDYKVFDYNGDGRDDILLQKTGNYFELLENIDSEGNFLNQKHLVQIYDLGNTFEVGDFTGDKFDDIFFISTDGKPYLLNNIGKDFERIDLSLSFNLEYRLTDSSVFDMDNDGIKDIIVLDEGGNLNIFYGGGNSGTPSFTKKFITNGLGLSLSSSKRNDGGAIYYSTLYQPDFENTNTNTSGNIDKNIVNAEIFVNLPYDKSEENIVVKDFEIFSENKTNTRKQKYFLKSDYFSSMDLEYEKTFIDKNGGNLLNGDKVEVEIKLKNNSSKILRDVAFVEKFEPYFIIDRDSVTNSKNLEIKSGIGNYNFLIEGFSILPGETITIKYSGVSKNLVHLFLRTGLFEKGEPGDDLFGDIVVEDASGNVVKLYKSVSERDYNSFEYQEQCDMTPLPPELQKVSEDKNNDGVPDFIEELKNSTEKLTEYSSKELSKLNNDSDGDGIPDEYDYIDNRKTTAERIELTLDKTQQILDGLSCGFSNGACFSSPLNWAPLAPGSDPVFMGTLIGDGLMVEEGLPIFSALTGIGIGPLCIPTVWPPSPIDFGCSQPSAGGWLGTYSPSNFFRIFVTPTLTGGVGTAICFGGPASTIGNSIPQGLAPLMPGGNCIVLAKSFLGCSNDGSDGDPASLGIVDNYEDFGIINGSSRGNGNSGNGQSYLSNNDVKNYLSSSGRVGVSGNSIKNRVVDRRTTIGDNLFNLGNSSGTGVGLSVGFGKTNYHNDFSDVIEISNKRISSFPSFFMGWVTSQVEEIVSKLTDFPTVYVILPDFSGIYDIDSSFDENLDRHKKAGKTKTSDYSGILNTSGASSLIGSSDDLKNFTKTKTSQVNSGIQQVYELISTMPLIKLSQENIYINIPWISDNEFHRAKYELEQTIAQWKSEVNRFYENDEIKDKEFKDKILVDINGLIGSVEKNIQVLESYRKFPEKVKELVNKKEDYLEQVLCNLEIISEVTSGWISRNGERFKSWVELYILIKAILKSWQSFLDIFINYENQCKECKNERHDSVGWQFQIISMLFPKIPVVKFPKWPDIVLDLHNIRAGMDITLPEFVIKTKPINIPRLPNLNLPNVPDAKFDITLPEIKILPELDLPELPDLPTLPEIELPNLPPPPKLPKLFENFEIIIDLAKLITKAMCILKSSPLHPEWRAGDQIAYLTERNGYLSFDFFNLNIPQFQIPFIDAIEVTSYVNLEYKTDFVVEYAKRATKQVNSFTSDFVNKLNVKSFDIDVLPDVPSSINVEGDFSYNENSIKLAEYVYKAMSYLDETKNEEVSAKEFKDGMNKFLSSLKVTSDPAFDNLRENWNLLNSYNFSKEDELIDSLQEFNFEKYETLKNIIETEKIKNKNLEIEILKSFSKGTVKVSEKISSVEKYNDEMERFNSKTRENISNILNYDEKNSPLQEIKDLGEGLKSNLNDVFENYEKNYKINGTPLDNYAKANKLLAANTTGIGLSNTGGTCSAGVSTGGHSYNYSGIYTIEGGRSYRLFDYIDEVKGDEKTLSIDYDLDGDSDLLYFVNGTLYLKENFSKDKVKKYLNQPPIVVKASDNKFLKNNFIESVNNAVESSISNNMISISFSSLQNIFNYRLSFFDIVDKSLNKERIETDVKKHKTIVDGIAGANEINVVSENELFTTRKDLVYLNRVGNYRGLEAESFIFKSIKNDLAEQKTVTISSGSILYSGNSSLNISFKIAGNDNILKAKIGPNSHIEANQDLIIVESDGGFVNTFDKKVYIGDEIKELIGLPLLFDSKIYYSGEKLDLKDDSYADLAYYDNSELRIDFNLDNSWELYDLGAISQSYSFILYRENDYYYSKINGFKKDLVGTSTGQILLSPQLKADGNAPEIDLNSIKIPVYQELEIDLTDKIFEDLGPDGIEQIYIDFLLETDTDGDGNPKNDNNSTPSMYFSKKDDKIILKLGKFNYLVKKKIGINLIDKNGNYGYKEIDFEIYSPIPEIESYDGVTISGKISEELKDEPINFYRFRAGNLEKLGDLENNVTIFTTESGEFSLESGIFKGGLTIKDISGKEIASVSEKTGKISFNSSSKNDYSISVSRDELNYPQIFIKDKSGQNIFNQKIRVVGTPKVGLVENFENIEKNGVYVKLYDQNNISYYVLPETISNNPGVLFGYNSSDKNQTPIFKIYPDGRLELPNNYRLNHNYYKDYILLEVVNNSGKKVLEIFMKIDAEYVIN